MFKTRARSVFGALVCLAMALPASGQCGDWQFQNPTPQGNRLGGVAFGHGTFVAVGSAGTVLTSPDGVSWTPRLSNTSADLESVAWTGALFAAVGSGGASLTSPDGISWTGHGVGVSSPLHRISWAGAQFTAVGDGGAIVTSSDGAIWVPRSSGSSKALRDVAWDYAWAISQLGLGERASRPQ